MKNGLLGKVRNGLVVLAAGVGLTGCSLDDVGRIYGVNFKTGPEKIADAIRDANDPWRGTPIVNQYNTPDGDMVFVIDATRVGRRVEWSEIDNYVDSNKYFRVSSKNVGDFGGVLIYRKK